MKTPKLDRLTPRQIFNRDMTPEEHVVVEQNMRAEMFAEMEKDWEKIGGENTE